MRPILDHKNLLPMRRLLLPLSLALSLAACNTEQNEQNQHTQAPEQGPSVVDRVFELGDSLSQHAQMQLGGQLKAALGRGGVAEAIPYCNVTALPLMDSLGSAYGVSLRRTALKVRNPADEPTPPERDHLEKYSQMLKQGEEMVPQVEALPNGQLLYSKPIITQGMCLNCHGTVGESMKPEDYALIQEHYPADSATGFAMGDLRGMWSITFDVAKVKAAME